MAPPVLSGTEGVQHPGQRRIQRQSSSFNRLTRVTLPPPLTPLHSEKLLHQLTSRFWPRTVLPSYPARLPLSRSGFSLTTTMTRHNHHQSLPLKIVTTKHLKRATNSQYSSILGTPTHRKSHVLQPKSAHHRSITHDFCIKKSTRAHSTILRALETRKETPARPNSLFDLLRPTQLLFFLRYDATFLAAIIAGVRFANWFSLLARHRHISLSGALTPIITSEL